MAPNYGCLFSPNFPFEAFPRDSKLFKGFFGKKGFFFYASLMLNLRTLQFHGHFPTAYYNLLQAVTACYSLSPRGDTPFEFVPAPRPIKAVQGYSSAKNFLIMILRFSKSVSLGEICGFIACRIPSFCGLISNK
jgi:hypothetical protein